VPAILHVLASQPNFLREDYVAASGGHEVAVWARLWGTAPDFQIAIGNDSNSDSYRATSFNNVSTEPGLGVQIISWDFIDPTGTALSNAALKKTAPVLSSWQFNQLDVEGREDARYLIRAHVTQAVKVA
jgi:hypothetical protein